jgi:hypothetical protein
LAVPQSANSSCPFRPSIPPYTLKLVHPDILGTETSDSHPIIVSLHEEFSDTPNSRIACSIGVDRPVEGDETKFLERLTSKMGLNK